MTFTLGLGGSNHDFSASLLKNGRPVSFIEDERINRKRYGFKHWIGESCASATEYVCNAANISLTDIDQIFISNDIESHNPFWNKYPHTKVGHHLCHASAAFYTSPFDEAAILVIDGKGGPTRPISGGVGEFETISMGFGKSSEISIDTIQTGEHQIATSNWTYVASNSIGWFYSIVTECVGMGDNGEGKTMALAAYGQPTYKSELLEFVKLGGDNIFEFSPYSGLWSFLVDTLKSTMNSFNVRADLAASAQSILEDVILHAAKVLKKRSNMKFLVYGGGVALNGIANHRIRNEAGFDDIFIYPASGDNGLSMGAALYGYHHVGNKNVEPRSLKRSVEFAFGGKIYEEAEMVSAVRPYSVSMHKPKTHDLVVKILVDKLLGGDVIAIFQGRSEFGPRALGNRSLIALPSIPRIQKRLNLIKRRESFRPFAPIVLEEDLNEYFDIEHPSPFMLEIAPVKEKYRSKLAGIAHIDGSARVQTLAKYQKGLIRSILMELKKRNVPPIVVNTSLNLKGQPIVETPKDAMEAFVELDIINMMLGPFLIEKHTQLNDGNEKVVSNGF